MAVIHADSIAPSKYVSLTDPFGLVELDRITTSLRAGLKSRMTNVE
jgi:hypothetical protein